MHGLHLDSLTGQLKKVADEFSSNPARTIENIEQKLARKARYLKLHFDSFDFWSNYKDLPLSVLGNFTFEDICKLYFSKLGLLDHSVEQVFENVPDYELVSKIRYSWWRWGVMRGTWNDLVDVYNGIRGFSLGLSSEFAIRLDYIGGFDSHGYSKFSRTYIDGVFAFLVYYRGEHVMTIGFSVMGDRRLLIQQVQLKNPTGNRFLYRLPKQQVEFTIDLFARAFPGHELYLVDGLSLAKKTLSNYETSLISLRIKLRQYQTEPTTEFDMDYCERLRERFELLTASYNHLQKDAPRLAKLYAMCGQYQRGPKLVVNTLVHRLLQPQTTDVTLPG